MITYFSNTDPLCIAPAQVCVWGGGSKNWASSSRVILGFWWPSLIIDSVNTANLNKMELLQYYIMQCMVHLFKDRLIVGVYTLPMYHNCTVCSALHRIQDVS